MTSLTLKQKVSFKLKKQIQGNGFNYTLALNQVVFPFLQKAHKMIKDISIKWRAQWSIQSEKQVLPQNDNRVRLQNDITVSQPYT